jgi:hypothetical protein
MLEQGRRMDEKVSVISFATNMSLESAIKAIADYQNRYNSHYPTAVNFTLLGVQTIEDVSSDVLALMQVQMVERLPKQFE